jgi:membrane-bound lytic murein transglycosylase MltF
MIARALIAAVIAMIVGVASVQAQAPAPARSKAMEAAHAAHKDADKKLALADKAWIGDFDGMLERRMIRVAAPYSRSLFYIDKGREAGIGASLVRDFERWINQKYAKQLGKRPLTVYIAAVTRDRLFPDLTSGLADIAIGNLTVTAEREKIADFIAPDDVRKVDEIVVTGPASPKLATLEDLAGKTVHVRRSSSYYDSLVAQNTKFKAVGKPEMKLALVPDALEDEDMMEMLNAGLLSIIVVDDWKAIAWSKVLPKIALHDDIVLRDGAKIGWAIRKGSPKLLAELNDFYTSWAKKQGVVAYRMSRAMKSGPLRDPSTNEGIKRFEDTVTFFVKYGKEYDFDPIMLGAQGFQESMLDQTKRSRVGAIGVMQLMPATGKALQVGDITVTESNIHAGAKYMNELMTRYFADAKFDQQNRTLFAFASYNAGPGNIARMRTEAQKRGLDPNVWFNNVEVVTAEKIGLETTTYVRNIFKYYTSYRLVLEAQDRAAKARAALGPAPK